MADPVPRPRQIPLDLTWPRHDRASRADFIVSESNAAAAALLDHRADWPDGRLALVGPEGCGKTHMALVWAKENRATFIEEGLAASDVSERNWSTSGCVVFEDCDRRLASAEAETALFHLLNILREEGGSILLTARLPPARWGVRLPDLASRLSAVTVAEIGSPDDALLEQLVIKLFSDRDIIVKDRLATYLAKRMDRNAAAVEAVVAALDARSIETREPVSTRMAKEVFGW